MMTIAASSEEEELLYYIKLFLYAFVPIMVTKSLQFPGLIF